MNVRQRCRREMSWHRRYVNIIMCKTSFGGAWEIDCNGTHTHRIERPFTTYIWYLQHFPFGLFLAPAFRFVLQLQSKSIIFSFSIVYFCLRNEVFEQTSEMGGKTNDGIPIELVLRLFRCCVNDLFASVSTIFEKSDTAHSTHPNTLDEPLQLVSVTQCATWTIRQPNRIEIASEFCIDSCEQIFLGSK